MVALEMANYQGEMTSMSPSRAASGVDIWHRTKNIGSWCICGVLFLVEKVSKTVFWWWFHGFKVFWEFSFLIWGRFLFWTYFKWFNWPNLDELNVSETFWLAIKKCHELATKKLMVLSCFFQLCFELSTMKAYQIASEIWHRLRSCYPSTFWKSSWLSWEDVVVWVAGCVTTEVTRI